MDAGQARATTDFLEPEKAFLFSARALDAKSVEVRSLTRRGTPVPRAVQVCSRGSGAVAGLFRQEDQYDRTSRRTSRLPGSGDGRRAGRTGRRRVQARDDKPGLRRRRPVITADASEATSASRASAAAAWSGGGAHRRSARGPRRPGGTQCVRGPCACLQRASASRQCGRVAFCRWWAPSSSPDPAVAHPCVLPMLPSSLRRRRSESSRAGTAGAGGPMPRPIFLRGWVQAAPCRQERAACASTAVSRRRGFALAASYSFGMPWSTPLSASRRPGGRGPGRGTAEPWCSVCSRLRGSRWPCRFGVYSLQLPQFLTALHVGFAEAAGRSGRGGLRHGRRVGFDRQPLRRGPARRRLALPEPDPRCVARRHRPVLAGERHECAAPSRRRVGRGANAARGCVDGRGEGGVRHPLLGARSGRSVRLRRPRAALWGPAAWRRGRASGSCKRTGWAVGAVCSASSQSRSSCGRGGTTPCSRSPASALAQRTGLPRFTRVRTVAELDTAGATPASR